MDQLLLEIKRFRAWQNARYPGIVACQIKGEWETDYDGWRAVREMFAQALTASDPDAYTDATLRELVYIIARDNEMESLADCLCGHDKWFMRICELSLNSPEPDAKWQLAARLDRAKNKAWAGRMLEQLVCDESEYVRRRALLMLPKVLPEKAELYAERFWNQDIDEEAQAYQRMAILTMLSDIRSPLLPVFLNRAKEAGGQYLSKRVDDILSNEA